MQKSGPQGPRSVFVPLKARPSVQAYGTHPNVPNTEMNRTNNNNNESASNIKESGESQHDRTNIASRDSMNALSHIPQTAMDHRINRQIEHDRVYSPVPHMARSSVDNRPQTAENPNSRWSLTALDRIGADSMIQNLRTDLNHANTDLRATQDALLKARTEHNHTKRQLTISDYTLQELRTSLHVMETKRDQCKNETAAMAQARDKALRQNRFQADRIADLYDAIRKLERSKGKKEVMLEDSEFEAACSKLEIVDLREQISELEKENERKTRLLTEKQNEVRDSRQKIEDLEKKAITTSNSQGRVKEKVGSRRGSGKIAQSRMSSLAPSDYSEITTTSRKRGADDSNGEEQSKRIRRTPCRYGS